MYGCAHAGHTEGPITASPLDPQEHSPVFAFPPKSIPYLKRPFGASPPQLGEARNESPRLAGEDSALCGVSLSWDRGGPWQSRSTSPTPLLGLPGLQTQCSLKAPWLKPELLRHKPLQTPRLKTAGWITFQFQKTQVHKNGA